VFQRLVGLNIEVPSTKELKDKDSEGCRQVGQSSVINGRTRALWDGKYSRFVCKSDITLSIVIDTDETYFRVFSFF
jgi:hypothetical protein